MFVGHFGVAFGLKQKAPAVSLGTLFLAAQFIDLLWPSLLLLGIERVELAPGSPGPPLRFTHYPVSHSLGLVVVWAGLFGAAFYLLRRQLAGAVICGAAVISHWVLDLIVHHPDLPLLPGHEARYGMGLWASLPASLAVELLIFGTGVWLYLRATSARDRVGSIGLWSLIAFLLLVHVANVFGDPPPSVAAVAWVGHAQWLLVLWAYWVDAHRQARVQGSPATATA